MTSNAHQSKGLEEDLIVFYARREWKMYRKSLFTSENWISILYITLQALDVYTM